MAFVAERARAAAAGMERIRRFHFASRYSERRGQPGICDFTFGNPHEMPLPGLVAALGRHAVPQRHDWFAYKATEPEPQAFLAKRLSRELDLPFEPADLALTSGAFGAIAVAFHMLLDPGDEAVFSLPPWFCYESMLRAGSAVPVKVPLQEETFDLDLDAIEAAIGPRTRLVIVNTPHNPTGRIYDRGHLQDLANLLERASRRLGHRLFILSDEPYRRLRFDERAFTSPAAVYPWTLIAYSYGKVLLAPGQRLGYLAIGPLMPDADRDALRASVFGAQVGLGWAFPNALMQHALPDLEDLSIDLDALHAKRRRVVDGLHQAGYVALEPEGTFYVFAQAPTGDEDRFWNALADRDVFVMPGSVMEAPGWFRICLTAEAATIDRALPAFADVAAALHAA
ncbi:MAG: aminotransferase class I/II-fold pyridoxal phosphate-dependent enzyme [Pseudomonadota bacterium]